MIGGLVLAAGAAERFGGPKQLAALDGRPLLEHVLLATAAAPLDRVVVVLGAYAADVLARVPLHGAEPVVCDAWKEGIGASLRTGVDVLADCDAIVVVLGDQPRVTADAIARVVAARGAGAAAVRASYGVVAGHPVLVERELFGRLRALRGDEGARAFLRQVPVREVDCDGLGSADDVDTPEALREVAAR